jgi:uncharacterized protein
MIFEYLSLAIWSPYLAGAGIGILCCLAFILSDRPIGCSTAFVKLRGLIGRTFNAEKTERMDYYREIPPRIDWALMIIPGVMIGAFISALFSGSFHVLWVPSLWAATFGASPALRVISALAGGILLGFGARWAGGCTSGHGINGSIQLSLASMVTAACFFAGGIGTALLLFRVIGVW